MTSLTTAELKGRSHQEKVRLAGVIQSLKLKNNKKGDRYATYTLEDKAGGVEVIVWPEAYRRHEAEVHSEQPVLVSGSLDVDEERCQIIASEIVPLDAVAKAEVKQVHIQVPADSTTKEDIIELKTVLTKHQGQCQTFLHVLHTDHSETIISLPEQLKVAPTAEMLTDVEQLFDRGVASFQ